MTRTFPQPIGLLIVFLTMIWANHSVSAQSGTLEQQLKRAGANRSQLESALARSDSETAKAAMEFLVRHMPHDDLTSLSADFLTSNVELALEARKQAPWKIPDEIFLNYVLPYANIDEPRDDWREDFAKRCRPLVAECQTPSAAAQRLNETLFKEINVKYSTARKRANQSPSESMEQGLASCTGLSIILVDACRSVGVPARLVGIPSWKNKRGNHTWVEIWDQGWHFTGAAEPSAKGLNHAWFQNDAALADPDSKRHSIYAVSFQFTETPFPMVWSPGKRVSAINVTQRYRGAETKPPSNQVNVMIRVWDRDRTNRVVTQVELKSEDAGFESVGQTRGQSADMNDMLTLALPANAKFRLKLSTDKTQAIYDLVVGNESNQLVELRFPPRTPESPDTSIQSESSSLTHQQQDQVRRWCATLMDPDNTSELSESDLQLANQILKDHPRDVRNLVWESYRQSPPGRARQADFENKQVTFESHVSPYTVKEVGKRPESGWPLFIAMHGGGGAPQRVNDSQWRHMQIYYKDQPDVTGYKYLALRAPNNTWNGFYDDYVYPLVENLIQQFLVFGDVDPNKVFIMGYSHGGYGAFAIGPKIPYRFAAVHSSAAAPTDGQSSPKTLRNTRFTFMVGENDNAYGRRKRCEQFAEQIAELKRESPADYPVEFMFQPGYGHGGLPDRDMIASMYEHQRNPVPRHVTWEMTDSVVDHFYWLSVDQPAAGKLIDARIEGQRIILVTKEVDGLRIHLDQRLIEPDQPVEVWKDGSLLKKVPYEPSLATLCRSVIEMGDIHLACDFEIAVEIESKSQD